MPVALTLTQWSDIAQSVIAGAAIAALFGTIALVSITHRNARRARTYEYADRFNTAEMRKRAGEWREYLEANSYEDFKGRKWVERNDILLLANVIEEVAAMYNRGRLDRNVAAEAVGVYIEGLWEASKPFVIAARADKRADLFWDWEAMAADTPGRKLKVDSKVQRRRAWRRLLRAR